MGKNNGNGNDNKEHLGIRTDDLDKCVLAIKDPEGSYHDVVRLANVTETRTDRDGNDTGEFYRFINLRLGSRFAGAELAKINNDMQMYIKGSIYTKKASQKKRSSGAVGTTL